VNFVSRHSVYFSRVNSPIGLNAQLCCSRFELPLSRLTCTNINFVQSRVAVQSDVCCSVIRDLLRVKSRLMTIPGFNATDIDSMLESVCIL